MIRESASYRDPDGYVFYEHGQVYRCISNHDAPILLEAYESFFKEAVDRGWLPAFEKTTSADGGIVLKLETLPVITYPYEWGFEQLKQAALLTLDICLLALDHGLSLKDATAFNIQPYKGKMIFIDHTSFEDSDNRMPWRPYAQFCRHFLVPLLLSSRHGTHANKLFRIALDGPELEEACRALPFRDRLRPSRLFHIYLHSYFTNKFKDGDGNAKKGKRSGNQKAYLQHLKNVVMKIKAPQYETEWADYYNITNYEADTFHEKERLIDSIISQKHHSCIWDLGANNGHFSRIMAQYADIVMSMDIDHAAVDFNVMENEKQNKNNIYPIVMDLINPSPALGFGNKERGTIDKRSKPDMIVALALIHHLSITYNVPFSIIAEQLSGYHADLIIEYVDRDDSQFQKLLRSKDDSYDLYNQDHFEKSFLAFFDLVKKYDITGTNRQLYHFAPKAGSGS